MARAESLLVNDNPITKDTRAIDSFIDPHIFKNKLLQGKKILLQNATIFELDSRYDYRPDRLAYEFYHEDFYYPAILVANNLGSILQFKAELLNYKCYVPSLASIRSLIGKTDVEKIFAQDIVNNLFKDIKTF